MVKTPCFISSHSGVQKLVSFLCVAREKLERGTHPFRSYGGTHLAFGGTLDRRCHFKHVSLKQSRLCHCQTSTAHRQWIKVDSSVAIINIKNFPIGLHVMYLYFPDTPCKSASVLTLMKTNVFSENKDWPVF